MKTLLAIIITCLTFTAPSWALTVQEAVETALQYNPEIARSAAQVKASVSRTGVAKAPFWPSIGVNFSYWEADRDPSLASKDLSSTSTYASYNLFNGGSDWFRLKAARSRQASVEWQHQSTIADVILEVRKAYIGVLRSTQSLETSRKSLELLKKQHRDTELRLEQGLVARSDLLRVAVEMATAQQEVVTSDGNLLVARQELALAMGRPLDDKDSLSAVSYNDLHTKAIGEMQQEMFQSRSELKYLQNQLSAQVAERKSVYGDLLPDINLSYSYDQFGNEAFPDSDDTDYNSDGTAMLQASWDLFSGFETRYELATLKNEALALKEEIRATKDRLLVQLQSALVGYQTAHNNLETARTSLALQKRTTGSMKTDTKHRFQVL